MKVIGVIANRYKDVDLLYTNKLVEAIKKRGLRYKIAPYDTLKVRDYNNENIDLEPDEESVINQSDFIICLGGDGTFLKAARKASLAAIPTLGINLGNVGFLTEVDKGKIDIAVEYVANEKYQIEKRMMLSAVVKRNEKIIKKDIAINDVVISKVDLARILRLNVYVDNGLIDKFPGDGFIVSTPTGSTAYSMSAGGPIVQPDMRLMILTPICPHTLYSRAVIAEPDKAIRIQIDNSYKHRAMMTCDGQEGTELLAGDIIEITKSDIEFMLASIERLNFYDVLRKKIYGGGAKSDEI